MRFRSWMRAGALGCCCLISGVTGALAAGTDPTLALTGVSVLQSGAGILGVRVTGTFQFDDLVQGAIPAGLILFQGESFIRYDMAGTIAQGSSSLVLDGVTADDVAQLTTIGTTAAGASIGAVDLDHILCTVPASGPIVPGNAAAIVFMLVEGGSFVSNTINFTVP